MNWALKNRFQNLTIKFIISRQESMMCTLPPLGDIDNQE